jgi:competence protein ComGC
MILNRRISRQYLDKQGITFFEVILIIGVLGILGIAAIPSFIDLNGDVEVSAMTGVISEVQRGIQYYRDMDSGRSISDLDSAADGACGPNNVCFRHVLNRGVIDGRWSKRGNVYTYTPVGEERAQRYTYIPENGVFK